MNMKKKSRKLNSKVNLFRKIVSRKEIKMSVNQKSDENIINNIFKIILYVYLTKTKSY